MNIVNAIKNVSGFGHGHERTNRAKKNIIAGFIIKGLNIFIGLLLMPITINYLDNTNYGIWVTMTSVVAWFGFFDIGFGNGLRNRFAEALAKGDHKLAKTYVSTTYAIMVIIISIFLVIFYVSNFFLNWNSILNTGTNEGLNLELRYLAFVVFTTFGFTFIFNLIGVILNADQKSALSATFDLIGKSISLLLIFILTKVSEGSLLTFGIIYSGISPLVLLIATIWFFKGKYNEYKPSFSSIDFSKAKDLFSLGFKFFLIQVSAIILYQTNNMIISQLFGPAFVTPYAIAYKYFSVLMMGFMIIVGPFWSAFTEAWVKNDIHWIKSIMRNLIYLWLFLLIICLFMLVVSHKVYELWIGSEIYIPFLLSLLVAAWVLLNTWNGIFSQFLNGVGKIKLQMYLGLASAIVNIPLAIFLGKKFGVEGVILANLIVLSVGVFVYPLQYYYVLNHNPKSLFKFFK